MGKNREAWLGIHDSRSWKAVIKMRSRPVTCRACCVLLFTFIFSICPLSVSGRLAGRRFQPHCTDEAYGGKATGIKTQGPWVAYKDENTGFLELRENEEGGQEEEKGKQHTFLNSRKIIENSEAKGLFGTILSKVTQKEWLLKLRFFLCTLRGCWYYYSITDIKLPTISQQLIIQ